MMPPLVNFFAMLPSDTFLVHLTTKNELPSTCEGLPSTDKGLSYVRKTIMEMYNSVHLDLDLTIDVADVAMFKLFVEALCDFREETNIVFKIKKLKVVVSAESSNNASCWLSRLLLLVKLGQRLESLHLVDVPIASDKYIRNILTGTETGRDVHTFSFPYVRNVRVDALKAPHAYICSMRGTVSRVHRFFPNVEEVSMRGIGSVVPGFCGSLRRIFVSVEHTRFDENFTKADWTAQTATLLSRMAATHKRVLAHRPALELHVAGRVSGVVHMMEHIMLASKPKAARAPKTTVMDCMYNQNMRAVYHQTFDPNLYVFCHCTEGNAREFLAGAAYAALVSGHGYLPVPPSED